jgi:hypothetical protein
MGAELLVDHLRQRIDVYACAPWSLNRSVRWRLLVRCLRIAESDIIDGRSICRVYP